MNILSSDMVTGFKYNPALTCAQSFSGVRLFATPRTAACQEPWNSAVKNTGVGCHALLQGILPTQRLNPLRWHLQVDSLPQHHLGSP